MEFILEVIFEFIIEGTLAVGSHKKVPIPLRILAMLVYLLIWGAVIGAIFYVGYEVMQDGKIGATVFFFIVAVGMLLGSIYMIVKKIREHHKAK